MKNIDKEFVPYQEALELNELGFDYQCVNYYSHYGNGQVHLNNLVLCSKIGVETNNDKGILAPLYQQAFRWFREKYNLHNGIYPYYDEYEFQIKDFRVPTNTPINSGLMKYEEAELACLKKLIDIVKEKKDQL